MRKIEYTPDAADKLRSLKKEMMLRYGSKKVKEVVGSITNAIRGLADNEQKGPSVEKMFGVTSNYRYLFVAKNYIFYSVESDCIRIVNIYNEKEDFLWLLFGIDTTSQETLDYWGEKF